MSTALSFNIIAARMAKRGIPIVPVRHQGKVPLPKDWQNQASTKPQTILNWIVEYGNDINCGCVATSNGVWFLDADSNFLWQTIEEETGKKLPRTFTTGSRKGQHKYWLQTPASRAMGNRKAHTDKYEFDAQVDRRQVIAPGSTHPSGFVYNIVDDYDIVEAPDWLVEWVALRGVRDKPASVVTSHAPLSDDFAPDDLFDFFDISGRWEGEWFITDECPIAGHKHEQSTRTGFFYDGSTFGFHCFAGSCEGTEMSVGKVIASLNVRKGEPYRGKIWEQDDEDLFDGIEDVDDHDFVEAEEKRSDIMEPDEVFALLNEGVNITVAMDQTNTALPGPVAELVSMPKDALYGRLGRYAEQMDMALGLAYPALLGSYSVIPNSDEMGDDTRINMYVALLSVVGGGKNTALKRARTMLDIDDELWQNSTMVSDRGLMNLVGDRPPARKGGERVPGPTKLLIATNEMNDVIRKMGVQNSTLATTLCDLWDENRKTVSDRTGRQTCDCRLSWVGGIPVDPESPEEFADLFSRETAKGLVSRFIFGYSGTRFNFRKWTKPAATINVSEDDILSDFAISEGAVNPVMTPAIYDRLHNWQPEEDESGRLRYNLFKVALLTAAANGDAEVTSACADAATAFMEWQRKLKLVFRTGEAVGVSEESKFNEILLNAIEAKGGLTDYINWKRLMYDRKWHKRFTLRTINTVVDNLIKAAVLVCEEKAAATEKSKAVYNTDKVKLNKYLSRAKEAKH